jgi:hypothetical protein
MNSKNENFTPRERVDAQLLSQLLAECDGIPCSVTASARPNGGCPSCRLTPSGSRGIQPVRPRENRETDGISLAMVYSPAQEFDDLYDPEEGLYRGTIFVKLDKPLREGCNREGRWKA